MRDLERATRVGFSDDREFLRAVRAEEARLSEAESLPVKAAGGTASLQVVGDLVVFESCPSGTDVEISFSLVNLLGLLADSAQAPVDQRLVVELIGLSEPPEPNDLRALLRSAHLLNDRVSVLRLGPLENEKRVPQALARLLRTAIVEQWDCRAVKIHEPSVDECEARGAKRERNRSRP